MLDRFRTFLSAKIAPVAPKKGAGGGSDDGMLPPIAPPKTRPGQTSFPDYLQTTRPYTARFPKNDLGLANLDIASTYRAGATSNDIIYNLSRANPDLAAAVSAYLRVGIPEKYIALARDPDGTVNDDATRLCWEMLQRFDKLTDYTTGFSQIGSIRSVSESLAKEAILYGGMAMELVLDKNRLPYKFQPVSITKLYFYQDIQNGVNALRPIQLIAGEEIDLDIPTFFMVYLDASLLDQYPQSPIEASIQPVLASSQFLADLRRVLYRHVYPRYDVTIDEKKLRENVPPDILLDDDKLSAYLNTRIAEARDAVNNAAPEDAIVHFDFITITYIKDDDGQGTSEKFKTMNDIINANLAKGAKTLPAILGNGAGTQNVASTETMLFLMSANSMVRLKLQEIYSKALTLACRLFGLAVTVDFEFDEIELRPETELAAFRAQEIEQIKMKWSCGLMSDMEASLRLTGCPTPAGFVPRSGTDFMPLGANPDIVSNPYSGTSSGGGQSGGGALNQGTKPAPGPTQKKGGQTK